MSHFNYGRLFLFVLSAAAAVSVWGCGMVPTTQRMVNATGETYVFHYDGVDIPDDSFLPIETAGAIGVELTTTPPFTFLRVIKGSPADSAGLKAGERLMEVDDEFIYDHAQAEELLFGEADSSVSFVVRGTDDSLRSYTLKRAPYELVYKSTAFHSPKGKIPRATVGPNNNPDQTDKAGKKPGKSGKKGKRKSGVIKQN